MHGPILINCIEGLSASSRAKKVTISYLAKRQIKKFLKQYPDELIIYNKADSSKRSAVKDSLKFIKNNSHYGVKNTSLLLIGKSMGGAKTWWMLKDKWKKLYNFKRIYVLTVDPHGPIVGDGTVGPYGKNKELPYHKYWRKKQYQDIDLTLINLYQHDAFPHGAYFNGAYNIRFGKGADHWNITNVKSKHSKNTKKWLYTGLLWLRGE